MVSAAILDFQFCFIFQHTALLGVRIRLCMPNFVTIGLTVQKLLPFLFSTGNALTVSTNWGFWRFLIKVKTEIFMFLSLNRQLLVLKHAFWNITRQNRPIGLTRARSRGTQKIMAWAAILDFQFFWLLSIRHFWGSALDSACQISYWSDLLFKSY